MEKYYRVFISSTQQDLLTERQAVICTLLKINCIPLGMEFFPSTGEHQWEIIKRSIEQCDYYLLIIAGMYGTINCSGVGGEEYRNISYTEMEYTYARSLNKPIIACIHNNICSLPYNKIEKTIRNRKKLDAFRKSVKDTVETQFWGNKDELCAKISTSMPSAFVCRPAPGLIPASIAEDRLQDSMSEIEDLKAQNALLLCKSKRSLQENAKLLDEIGNLYQQLGSIYVRTKDGQLVTMPNNSTALDFAFYIHKMVGLCTRKIVVTPVGSNKPQLVSFSYQLQAGDTISVVSDSGSDGKEQVIHAKPQWMQHLRTDKAKKCLRSAIKNGLIG